ncbi:MAG: glycosyltransferase family 8 protein [Eubacteriales bacterium]|nr:glycosyltransferase family 8 protein [Eubacteriales bacterium]
MNTQTEIIPIFFSIDDGYAPFLSVALNSMIQNASKRYHYKAIVLYKDLSIRNHRKIARLATDNFEIQFVSMENRLDGITDRTSIRLRCDYFTFTIFFRLFIPVMFPEYDKGIYLDSDVVVPGDISELYHTELGDNFLGAVADHSVVDIPPLANYIERAVGIEKHHYINSGVLLMNLKELREARLDQRFFELLNKYHFECIAPDQDYLNALCSGRIAYLPPCWDAMPRAIPAEGAKPVNEPKLIHYNLFSKPWCYDSIQYESYFWQYAQDSGYLEEILDYKTNYGPEKQKSDQQSLELLLSSGERLANSAENFRTIFESGKERRL